MAEYIQSISAEDINKNTPTKRSLRTKKPFVRILPYGHYDHGTIITGTVREETPVKEYMRRKRVTQEDFLRELDPAGHLINDREYYPDIWRQNTDESDKENFGKWFLQEVPRYAFAFQQVILQKQLTHLCGNDIQFELSDKEDNDANNNTFNEFRRGWAKKNMEVAWYKSAKSVKATGDGALIGFLDNGKFGWKIVSFLDGDRLYPHYDMRTGRLMCFAREFTDIDDTTLASTDYIEVWDDKYYYRFSSSAETSAPLWDSVDSLVKSKFDTDGYVCEEMSPHNFPSIPVAYKRDDNGPCWTASEESIENYEMAFSRLAQSNHDFGLPIMYVKGEGSTELSNADLTHASKIFFLPSDGEIGFLNRQDASAAYNAELEKLEEQIYKQSFTVKAPELKSGDTPGVAIKLMYSDAYEKAMIDSQEYDAFIDKVVEIFQYGYGVETGKLLDFQKVNISHYIKPYVHQNDQNIINDLSMSIQNGFISKQTASEKNPYAIPSEWTRIVNEKKEQEQMDLLLQEQKLDVQNSANVDMQGQLIDMQTDANIKAAEAQADINNDIDTKNTSGNNGDEGSDDDEKKAKKVTVKKGSVATGGRGGRPNLSGRVYTESRNWPGRSNWRKYDTYGK